MNRAERRRAVREMRRVLDVMLEEQRITGCDCIPRLVEVVDGVRCPCCGLAGPAAGEVSAMHSPPEAQPGGLQRVVMRCPCGRGSAEMTVFVLA